MSGDKLKDPNQTGKVIAHLLHKTTMVAPGLPESFGSGSKLVVWE